MRISQKHGVLVVIALCLLSGLVHADAFYQTGGKRVDNLYDFTKSYHYRKQTKRNFHLDEDVSDAWVYTCTGNDPSGDTVSYTVNGKLAYVHKPNPRARTSGSIYLSPVSGFRKGDNEFLVENIKGPFMVVIHLKSGKEVIVEADDNWVVPHPATKKWVKIKQGKVTEKKTRYFGTARPYAGLIKINNPGKRMPVFAEGGRILQEVVIPREFYGLRNPVLSCKLENCWTKERPKWGEKIRIKGKKKGDKIVYTLKLRACKKGAYTVTYSFGPYEGHKRRAELIVIGRIEQKKVAPEDIFRSLTKKMVDSIDCSDPRDSHTFEDVAYRDARVMDATVTDMSGKRIKISYRETGDRGGQEPSRMSWEVALKHTNRLHLVEYDYPDNRNRVFTVAVFHDDSMEYPTETTNICGGEFPLSDEVKTGRLLFYSRTPRIKILVANKEAGTRGAVQKIRIYEILDERLPMADVEIPEGKLYMELNERSLVSCIDMYPGSDYAVNMGGFGGNLREGYDQLRRYYLALENLICYIRFCGENGYMPGSVMYGSRRYPSWDSPYIKTDGIGLLAEMLSVNDLNLVLMSHYFADPKLLPSEGFRVTCSRPLQRYISKYVVDVEKQGFADPVVLIDKDGKPRNMYDMSHPRVREAYLKTLREQIDLYGTNKSFKGIMVFISSRSSYGPSFISNDYGYGDGTMKRFKEFSKCDMPEFGGPDRFSQRYDWIMKNAGKKWENFKCAQFTSIIKQAQALITETSDDARLFVCPFMLWHNPIAADRATWLRQTDLTYRSAGCDIDALKKLPGTVIVNQLPISRSRMARRKRSLDWHDWMCRSEELLEYYFNGENTAALLIGGYYENHFKWGEHAKRKSLIGAAAGAYDHYLHQLNVALAGQGASDIFNCYIDCNHHMGHELYKAKFARTFSLIPKGNYSRIKGSNQFVIGRTQSPGEGALFYVTNTKAFDTELELRFKPVPGRSSRKKIGVVDVETGGKLDVYDGTTSIVLDRYQTKVFRCSKVVPEEITRVTPDTTQLAQYERQGFKGDRALEVGARLGDHGHIQVLIKNTGNKLAEDFIKITRHDSSCDLEGTFWTYGPLDLGEKQIVSLPGRIPGAKDIVSGIVHTPEELSFFSAGGRKILYAEPVENDFGIDGRADDWKGVRFQSLDLHIRGAGREAVRSPEEMRKYPDIKIDFAAAWKKDGLYFLFDIPDKELMRNKPHSNRLWTGDSISLFLDLDPVGDCINSQFSDDDMELIFAPADNAGRIDEVIIGHPRLGNILEKNPGLLQWKSSLTERGYVIEIRLADRMLPDMSIYPGRAIGFDIRVSDLDASDANQSYSNRKWNRRYYEWHNRDEKTGNESSTRFFGILVLKAAEKDSAASVQDIRTWEKRDETGDGKVLYSNDFETEISSVRSYTMKLERVKKEDFSHGSYSLKAPFGKWDGKHYPVIMLNSPLTVSTGNTYRFSVWVYSEKNSIGRIDFGGNPHIGYDGYWTIHKEIILKRGWNRYSITERLGKSPVNKKAKQGGEDIEEIVTILRFYQEGTYYVDDFMVAEVKGGK